MATEEALDPLLEALVLVIGTKGEPSANHPKVKEAQKLIDEHARKLSEQAH